jgi:cell division protein FtsQ
MEQKKRKISVRKVLQVLVTVVMSICCIVAIVSASRIEGAQPLKGLPVVHISNDRRYQFIEQQHIMDLAVYNRNIDIVHLPVAKLDMRGMEKAIMADPWVQNAQVYIDANRIMHMYVTQRVPVARLFGRDGNSCYMDSTLHIMPLSETYTYYTTVVTNVPLTGNDSADIAMKKQIAHVVKTIRADSFWAAQVAHVVIDTLGEFELVPVLGEHRIRIGDTNKLRGKLTNLMVFYKNVLNRIGWDKYEVLDARFKDQVVASPGIRYDLKDKAAEKMSWVARVREAQAQSRVADSVNAAARAAAQLAAEKIAEDARNKIAEAKKNKHSKKDKEKKPEGKKLKGHEALENLHKTLKHHDKANKSKKQIRNKVEKKQAEAAKADTKHVAEKATVKKEHEKAHEHKNEAHKPAPDQKKKTDGNHAAKTVKKEAEKKKEAAEKEIKKKEKSTIDNKPGKAKYSYPGNEN